MVATVPDISERSGSGQVVVSPPERYGVRKLFGWLRWRPGRGHGLSYRYLARQLEVDLPTTDGGRLILISSALSPDRSNEAVLMLGYHMTAELGRRVLLIDGTLGTDGVGAALGHKSAPGLLELVRGSGSTLLDMVRPTKRQGISILPAGRSDAAQWSAVEPARIAECLRLARREYDYVLMQQGAIYDDPRYLAFASRAEMVLLLVEEGDTLVDELEHCKAVFRGHQIGNLRLVLSTPR